MYRWIELALVTVVLGMAGYLAVVDTTVWPVLQLYYLPVTLAGFLLGRFRASVLALLCVLSAAIAFRFNPNFQFSLELIDGMGGLIWASILGLTANLVGSISDTRRGELNRLRQQYEHEVYVDGLTGLSNRLGFDREIGRRMARCDADTIVSVLALDIDHFKQFNDAYGHDIGDAVLQSLANTVRLAVRPTDLVCRVGGEEFFVVASAGERRDVANLALRINRAVAKSKLEAKNLRLGVTVSVGVAFAKPDDTLELLAKRADQALYTAKQHGRDRCYLHTGSEVIPVLEASCGPVARPQESQTYSYLDHETKLPPRIVFEQELRRRHREVARYKQELTVMIVRVASANDNADELGSVPQLRATIARGIQSALRDCDLVTSYAEDLYAVHLPCTNWKSVVVPASRIAENMMAIGKQVDVSLETHVGIAQVESEQGELDVVDRALHALEIARDREVISCVHDGINVESTTAPPCPSDST